MEHTPTDWQTHGGEFIRDGDGRALAYCQSASGKRSVKEVHANAAFIVQAVNSHDTLVDALKIAVIDLEDWLNPDGDFDVSEQGLRDLRKHLDKAIANATKEGK